MGRPKGSPNKKKVVPAVTVERRTLKDASPKKICSCCEKPRASSRFYKSFSDLSADGLGPFCKECTAQACLNENGFLDVDKLDAVLQQLNRPFLKTVLDASVSEYKNKYQVDPENSKDQTMIVSLYMKNIGSLPQYSKMTYSQGVELEKIKAAGTDKKAEQVAWPTKNKKVFNDTPIFLDDIEEDESEFEVTRSIINRFGQGYTRAEYKAMVEKYDFLSQSYPDLTNLHTEALITYIRYKVKEEFATASGAVDEAEKWAALATKAADKAKLNPSQLSQNDLQGGLNSFSELMMAIEQVVDIVPILPQFKYRPQDAVDFTIWCYVNYIRKAEGKPLCEYEDVYRFYDERKAEYIAQYGDPAGIFADDPTEKNRESIKKFITLPVDYGDADG